MSFTTQAWERIAPIRAAIDELPLLTTMEDGTLEREVFEYYLAQDAHYLADYGRALALAGGQASDPDELIAWTDSARGAVVVERELHGAHVEDFMAMEKSPTCTAYTSYLLALASGGCYPALIAGILPCFWIYEDVGTRMLARLQEKHPEGLGEHPYGDWIGTYGDPDFAAASARARQIVDHQAELAGDEVREKMMTAFVTTSRYEWMFWDAPMRLETWSV